MPGKILVADDDEEILELLESALTVAGYKVHTVRTGINLINLIKQEKPDLMLLDVMMPGMDGYSLQLDLSQKEETRTIPVIILTALPASKALFEKFEQVKHFINKPFDLDKLIENIKELLKNN